MGQPRKPFVRLPSECDKEVGGVLIILLDPARVQSVVDAKEDKDDELEGESGFVGCLFASDLLASKLRPGALLECGVEWDRPLEKVIAPDLSVAGPLVLRTLGPANLDIRI